MQSALYESKMEIDLITDSDILNLFQANIREGLTLPIKVRVTDQDGSLCLIDYNSLYASCMLNKLAYSNII